MATHRCVGAVVIKNEQVLLGRRAQDRRFYPDVWDVFGGHIEEDEGAVETLIRELKEEIGVEPMEWSFLETIAVNNGEDVVECHLYRVTAWRGEPTNRQIEEHSAIQWFPLESVQCLPLAHPSYPALFARALKS